MEETCQFIGPCGPCASSQDYWSQWQKRWTLEWDSRESNFPNQSVPGFQLSRESIGDAIPQIIHSRTGPRIESSPGAPASAAVAPASVPIIGDPTGVDPVEEVERKAPPGNASPSIADNRVAAEAKSDHEWQPHGQRWTRQEYLPASSAPPIRRTKIQAPAAGVTPLECFKLMMPPRIMDMCVDATNANLPAPLKRVTQSELYQLFGVLFACNLHGGKGKTRDLWRTEDLWGRPAVDMGKWTKMGITRFETLLKHLRLSPYSAEQVKVLTVYLW